jgi:hypothetical protein
MLLAAWPSVERAAAILDLQPRRVRSLIASGALAAEKVGRDWLVDPLSLDRLRVAERPKGRPLAPAHAWALLWLASDEPILKALAARWLEPWAATRVRRALADTNWQSRLPSLRRRARVVHLHAHPSDLARLASEPNFLPTGTSAAQQYGFDIAAPGVVEGYVPADHLDELVDKYMLAPNPQPNTILHVVSDAWPFPVGARVAPAIAAAADLADSDEQRTREAGFAYLARLQKSQSQVNQ